MAKQADTYSDNNNRTIAYVRYIKIRTWLRGFRVKIANFSRLRCLAISRRHLSTKKTKPNIEKWPEILGFMVNISDVGYLRSFSNHEGCPIHPNWIRWTKAMNNQTHRKSVRERLSIEEGAMVQERRILHVLRACLASSMAYRTVHFLPSLMQLCCIFSKSLVNWFPVSPIDSCQDEQSPSDPIESVCQHLLPASSC